MISIGEIIYRIHENPLLVNVRTSDTVNHVKTVIELVGVPGLKQDKLIVLDIIEYRAQLPEDFLNRVSVRMINGNDRIVLTSMTDEFGKFNRELYNSDEEPGYEFTHKIADGYIYTDFKEGKIELLYKAYACDENGWPMIPRNESLVLAIENYIKARYYGILADQNANFERAYQRAEQQYNWYVAQATTSLTMLDPVEAQALGEMLVRLISIKDNFYSNFKYAGQPERLNKRIW